MTISDKAWDVFVYGDINIDLILPGVSHIPAPGQEDVVDDIHTCIGGGAALFIMGCGKLGLKTIFQTEIGQDHYGQFLLEKLESNQVDCSLVHSNEDMKTGISLSFTDEKDRSFLTYRGTNGKLDIGLLDVEAVAKSKLIHITMYAGTRNHEKYLELLRRIKEMPEVTVSFDVCWDDSGEWYEGIYELLPYIDILFMNETEAIHYSRKENVLDAMADLGKYCRVVVGKLGKKGSMAVFNGERYNKSGFTVIPKDTTGAGDSFNAGFVYGYLNGKDISQCLELGNACGALSTTAYGGNTAFPDVEELEKFLVDNGILI